MIGPAPPADRDPGGRAPRPTLVLLAEQRLVGDAVRAAMSGRRFHVVEVGWPDERSPAPAVRRAVAAARPNAGIVVGDLEDPRHRGFVGLLVSALPFRWALVVQRPDDPAWGDLVAVGATLLPSSISVEDLSTTMARLMTGVEVMPRRMREQIVREWEFLRIEADRLADLLARLTPREAEVLVLLSDGLSVKEIARRSEVADATVRTQVKAVLRKLEVSSQLAAVALARRSTSAGPAQPRRRGPQGRE